ncbi:MAG: glyceraldehyde 3-phosphate dehydrogenase NAD-binding domain-containing protein [Parcubacteria group bacterium]
MAIRIAINGAGRIGRAFYKLALERPEIEIVAVNDLGDRENIEYLLRHDTVYGNWHGVFDVKFFQEKEPAKLPWKELGIDIVIESTGFFASYAGSKAHLDAGAKRVIVTAPMKDEPVEGVEGATVLMGVNEEKLATCLITSNASCTTNAGSPLIAILDEAIGIEKAVLNTTHGYTASQALVDGPSKRGFREGRAAAQNIIPSSTGAATAVTKAFTKLSGLFDGIALRVPVVAGSLVDVTFIAKRNTTAEEVNNILKEAAQDDRWKGIFTATDEEIVSSDILGSPYGSIADLSFTRVVGGNLVKVLSWYDNEVGYCHTLVDHVIKLSAHIK